MIMDGTYSEPKNRLVQYYFMRYTFEGEVGQQYEVGSKLIRRGRMEALLKVYRSQNKCEDAKVWPPRPVHSNSSIDVGLGQERRISGPFFYSIEVCF